MPVSSNMDDGNEKDSVLNEKINGSPRKWRKTKVFNNTNALRSHNTMCPFFSTNMIQNIYFYSF